MKIFKRFLMGIGTVVLLALSLQLVAPKAVHAVVSTLVTIANTPANPVPIRDVADPTNFPYSAELCAEANVGSCDPSLSQAFVVPSVTSTGNTVKQLVIEYVSGSCTFDTTVPLFLDGVYLVSANPNDTNNPSSPDQPTGQFVFVYGTSHIPGDLPFASPVRMYVAPGARVGFGAAYGTNSGNSSYCKGNLTGYLVTQ
jgi:hypothetical protein